VDDDPDTVESTAELLTLYGFRVLTATSGMDAILVAADNSPDVVFLDLSMPGMDGFQLISWLREGCAGSAKRPLFVAVTGYGDPEYLQRTAEAGFDLHLTKPVAPPVLVGVVRRFARAVAKPCEVS